MSLHAQGTRRAYEMAKNAPPSSTSAAVPEKRVNDILTGFSPFYNEHSGVVFISDIQVTRLVKFSD